MYALLDGDARTPAAALRAIMVSAILLNVAAIVLSDSDWFRVLRLIAVAKVTRYAPAARSWRSARSWR